MHAVARKNQVSIVAFHELRVDCCCEVLDFNTTLVMSSYDIQPFPQVTELDEIKSKLPNDYEVKY